MERQLKKAQKQLKTAQKKIKDAQQAKVDSIFKSGETSNEENIVVPSAKRAKKKKITKTVKKAKLSKKLESDSDTSSSDGSESDSQVPVVGGQVIGSPASARIGSFGALAVAAVAESSLTQVLIWLGALAPVLPASGDGRQLELCGAGSGGRGTGRPFTHGIRMWSTA